MSSSISNYVYIKGNLVLVSSETKQKLYSTKSREPH